MIISQVRKRIAQNLKLRLNCIKGVTQLQNHPRVDYVLARRSPVNVAGWARSSRTTSAVIPRRAISPWCGFKSVLELAGGKL